MMDGPIKLYTFIFACIISTPVWDFPYPRMTLVTTKWQPVYQIIMHAGHPANEAEALNAGFRTHRRLMGKYGIEHRWEPVWEAKDEIITIHSGHFKHIGNMGWPRYAP